MRPTLAAPLLVALALACTDAPTPPPQAPVGEAPVQAPTPASKSPPPTEAPPPPADAEPAEPPPAPVGFMPVPPAFDALPITARLPAGAPGLVAVASPIDLARRIGWLDVLDALGPRFARERAELKQALGHDLFDPAAWAAAGVAPDRPAGVALLSLEPPIVAIAATLKNHETVRAVLLALAAGAVELKHTTEGDLHLLHTDRFAFGLRPGEGWVVLGDRLEPGEALHHARALAGKPAATLLARETVGEVISRLNYGRDIAAIINLPAIFDAVARRAMGPGPHARLERQIKGAEALGDAATAAELRAALKQARARAPEWGAGELALGMVLRSYLTPFGGLAFGVNIDAAQVQARFTHHLDRASPVGRIFASRTGPLALRDAFPRDPAGLAALNLNLVELWELARSLATATGGGRELGRMDTELREATGKDLAALLGLLAGDVGAAVEVDPARVEGARSAEALLGSVRFAGHLGLADPEAVVALIDRVVPFSAGALNRIYGPEDSPPVWRLVLDPTMTARVTVVGPQLFVSLDDETLARLTARSRPGAPTGGGFIQRRRPAVKAMLDGTDGGWTGWLDVAGLGPLMVHHAPRVTPDPPTGSDPRSTLLREMAALDRQIAEHQRAHRAAEVKRGQAMLSGLGRVAVSIRPARDGLDGRAGLYVGAPSVAAAARAFASGIQATEEASLTLWRDTLGPLFEKQRALRTRLERLDAAPAP